MASKEKLKEKNQLPSNKDAANWPDLPQHLINIISRNSTLIQNISFVGVSKSWKTAPKQCNPISNPPWLQLSDFINNQPGKLTIKFRQGEYLYRHPRYPPDHWHPWKSYIGFSHGEIVAKGATDSDYYLWNPRTSNYCSLPRLNFANVPCKLAVLSSPIPDDWRSSKKICTLMVLTGISHPAFMFYRVSRGKERKERTWIQESGAWIKQDCVVVDPNCSERSDRQQHYMQFTNAVGFQGKFYALSLQGALAVIEDIGDDFNPRISALGSGRAVPSVFSKHFRECLVESDGEILLIFLVSRKSVKVVDDVEVFRLDHDKLNWVKMDCIGDRTLFVGVDCCMCVSSSRVGCRRNCVYFTNQTFDGWWVYDMERDSILPGWTDANSAELSPVWIDPKLKE